MSDPSGTALEITSDVIAGSKVKIATASETHQDETTFMELNDDCILEILSVKSFTLMDLCSVAETCRRLKEIAGRVFKREHKKCDLNASSEGNANTAERILMNFGSEIRHLQMSVEGIFRACSMEILDSAKEYCNTTLQSLDLQFFEIPESFAANLGSLFENLQKLSIDWCTFDGASKESFANCGSLVELEIRDCRDDAAFILENTFPKLQHFVCDCFDDSYLFEWFISRHMNLRSLKIEFDLGSSSLQLIAGCKRLETLTCRISENATLDLSKLVHLRELAINCWGQNVLKTAIGLNSLQLLEHFTLDVSEIHSEFVRNLSQLGRLHALKLRACTGLQNWNQLGDLSQLTTLEIASREYVDLDIVLLVGRLSKLHSLTVDTPHFEMNLEKYLGVVDVVQRRPDKSKLTIRLSCFGHFYDDNLFPELARSAHIVQIRFDR